MPLRLEPVQNLTDEGATLALAHALGEHCRGGEVFLLEGPLGAGKTFFAGGLAAGLGVAGPVPSPTFVLLRSYPARGGLTLHHMDFYRLAPDGDATLGLEDCLRPDTVVLIEWASRCPAALDAWTLRLTLEPDPQIPDARTLRVVRGGLPLPPGVELGA